MALGGRTNVRTSDRVFHSVGWLLLFLIMAALYFGREWLVLVLWAVFSA